MRGDMCGAAVVVATCRAIASLRLPVNIRGLIPLCEHMISCNSIHPGDIVKAINGKTIEVEVKNKIKTKSPLQILYTNKNVCPTIEYD